MGAFIETLRSGQWLSRDRMRLWGLAVLAASAVGFIYILATSDGLNDYQNRPIGTDFSNVYAAGTYVLEGKAHLAFDWPAQHARERAIFGDNTPFYGWHYPPFFLFVAGYSINLLSLLAMVLAIGLVVDDAAMKRHLDGCSDVVFSGGVLLALVERGASRHEAYEWVQKAALGGPGMKDRLKNDERVANLLPSSALDRLFSLENPETSLFWLIPLAVFAMNSPRP